MFIEEGQTPDGKVKIITEIRAHTHKGCLKSITQKQDYNKQSEKETSYTRDIE